MVHPLTHVLINGYVIDWGSLVRLLLGLWTLRYFLLFGRRLDAALYQSRTRQTTFSFLALVALTEFSIAALETIIPAVLPALIVLRDIGRLGAAFTVFQINRGIKESLGAAIFFAGAAVVTVAGLKVDLVLAAAMALTAVALFDLKAYREKAENVSVKHYGLRSLFIVSLCASYAFAFLDTLLGIDLFGFEEASEIIALSVGFLSVRAASRSA